MVRCSGNGVCILLVVFGLRDVFLYSGSKPLVVSICLHDGSADCTIALVK
jgi:hypothetical protein